MELSEECITKHTLKRPFDLILSLVGLIVTSPLWLGVAIAIKLEDGGPVFYSQERWGKNKSKIKVYKFRTMTPYSGQRWGSIQARKNDPRITRVGKFLRGVALDELPQLINILKGEMSFVGPRALAINEMQVAEEEWNLPDERIPGFNLRASVKPGLTGMAQIYVPRDAPRREKFKYDILYIKRQSVLLDFNLIIRSLWITLKGKWEYRAKQ